MLKKTLDLIRELAPDWRPMDMLGPIMERYLGPCIGMTILERSSRLTVEEIQIIEEALEERLAIRLADGIRSKRTITHAITVWQPMAWAIAAGHKRVENRGWAIGRPGQWIAIHAGKQWHEDHARQMRELLDLDPPSKKEAPRGAILALVQIDRHARIGDGDEIGDDPFFSGPVGTVFNTVIRLSPIPCRGQQGLWPIPARELAVIEEALRG